jgi:DNA-binding CsgD family transcriptional regulator
MELNPGREVRPSLSMTERRVGALVAAGYADRQIAHRLRLSLQAVEWAVAKLCRTLEVGSRDELVVLLSAWTLPRGAR